MATAQRIESEARTAQSGPDAVDPLLVEETRREIRAIIHEITQLSQSQIPLEDFCEGFLTRVVSALAAVGGALWMPDENRRLRLQHQVNLASTGLAKSEETQLRHSLLLDKVAASGQPGLVPPQSGGDADGASNPTPQLLVIGVVRVEQEVEAIVEIFQRPGGGPTTHRGYLRFLLQMCELAADFLRNRRLRHLHDRQAMWEQLEQFTQAVHRSLDVRETALVIANEGRRLIGCDRVSVALARGRRYVVEAVSGLDSIDRRASEVRALGTLARAGVATGEPLYFTSDDSQLPPQIESALHGYVDRAHAKSLAIIPLLPPDPEPKEERRSRKVRPLGALIIEQFHERRFDEPTSRRIDSVVQHGALALAKANEHSRVFLLPLWKALGKAQWLLEARTFPKAAAAVLLVIAAAAALVLVPKDFTLAARGELQPVERRHVFAGVEGVVIDARVEHGHNVAAGDELLHLRNTDLEVEIASLLGQRTTAQEQILSAQRTLLDNPRLSPEERERLSGRLLELQETIAGLDRQLELLRQKEQQLTVRSPIAGEVVTWRLRDKLLHRPIERGQTLVTIVDPAGPWELELRMPERRVGHLVRAAESSGEDLPVVFHLATHPGEEFQGRVAEIHRAADVQGDDGNTVLVRVAVDRDQLPDLRPGATVNARVQCGQRPLGYVWFHEAIEAVQTQVMFWF